MEDPRYAEEPTKDEFPKFESLKLTIQRTLPYWNNVIVPQIKEGKSILIAAHGNSLRGIVKHLDGKELNPMSRHHFLILCLPKNFTQKCLMKLSWDSICPRESLSSMSWTRISNRSSRCNFWETKKPSRLPWRPSPTREKPSELSPPQFSLRLSLSMILAEKRIKGHRPPPAP